MQNCMIKKILKSKSSRLEVNLVDIFEFFSSKIFFRQLLKLKKIHETIQTAWELTLTDEVKFMIFILF